MGIYGQDSGFILLPKDGEGNPYEPNPQEITFFENMKVISVACGEAHTLVLVEGGMVYSFGGNSTGQLGYPEIEEEKNKRINTRNQNDSFPFVGKPQLITTLLGRNVIKLACGGVHNIVLTTEKKALALDLFKMMKSENSVDFEIILGNENLNLRIKCHKFVLISRSNYFREAIVNKKLSNLSLKKFNPLILRNIIEYIYLDDSSFLNDDIIIDDLLEYFRITR